MKTTKITFVILMMFFTVLKAHSTVHIITVSGLAFTPSSLSAAVGDTIKWEWVNGIHTTTSTNIPTNATSWNALMDTLHPAFGYVIREPGTYNYQCTYHYLFGMVGTITANPSGIKIINGTVPVKFDMSQNYPNPFNPSTNIKFDIPVQSKVQLVIYNLLGGEVTTLINQQMNPGSYVVDWNASELPSGVYFYKLATQGFSVTKKMILIK